MKYTYMSNFFINKSREYFLVFLTTIIFLLTLHSTCIADKNIFVVNEVKINVTRDLNFSRDKYIDQAFKNSFFILMSKILVSSDFNKITDDKIVSVNKRYVELFKGFITNNEDLENQKAENSKLGELKKILRRKNYNKSQRMVWGESGSQKSADTWLFKAADKTRPVARGFSKVFDNNEITVDNFKESSVIQFIKELERKKKKDFIADNEEEVDTTISGDSRLFNYIVKESELKKDNNK